VAKLIDIAKLFRAPASVEHPEQRIGLTIVPDVSVGCSPGGVAGSQV
jgi:hypothetical protein